MQTPTYPAPEGWEPPKRPGLGQALVACLTLIFVLALVAGALTLVAGGIFQLARWVF